MRPDVAAQRASGIGLRARAHTDRRTPKPRGQPCRGPRPHLRLSSRRSPTSKAAAQSDCRSSTGDRRASADFDDGACGGSALAGFGVRVLTCVTQMGDGTGHILPGPDVNMRYRLSTSPFSKSNPSAAMLLRPVAHAPGPRSGRIAPAHVSCEVGWHLGWHPGESGAPAWAVGSYASDRTSARRGDGSTRGCPPTRRGNG